jgi:short-subunit dehydrogenase
MVDGKGKVVVITGAANGLGKALAIEYYHQGYHLALIDIDKEGLEKLHEELALNSHVSIHIADVADEQQVLLIKEAILQYHERVDMLINNAGISISAKFEQMNLSDFHRLWDVNFRGTVNCCKHFLHELRQQPQAQIVNIVSMFAFMGFPGKTAYGASKAAIAGFSEALRTELMKTNVKVSLVIPPPLHTNIVKNGVHIDDEKREKEITFLEKNGMPLDIAAKKIVQQVNKGKSYVTIDFKTKAAILVSKLFPSLMQYFVNKSSKDLGLK